MGKLPSEASVGLKSRARYYIPTLGRLDHQYTWNLLPSSIRERTFLICPPNENQRHRSAGRNVLDCPVTSPVWAVWQWVVDNAPGDVAFILDDDLRYILVRKSLDDWHLRTASIVEIEGLFDRLEGHLRRGCVHVGVSYRGGNNHYTLEEIPHVLCTRQFHVFGYLLPLVRQLGVYFQGGLMSDFDVCMGLIQSGYANLLTTDFACDQATGGTNAKGGFSSHRSPEKMKRAALDLQQKYGKQFVRLSQRSSNWGAIQERTDVVLGCKKLWGSAKVKHGDWSDPKLHSLLGKSAVSSGSLLGAPSSVCFVENVQGKIRTRKFTGADWNKQFHTLWQESVENPKVWYRYSKVG